MGVLFKHAGDECVSMPFAASDARALHVGCGGEKEQCTVTWSIRSLFAACGQLGRFMPGRAVTPAGQCVEMNARMGILFELGVF